MSVDKFWAAATAQTDGDLRTEFNELVNGKSGFGGIGQILVIRSMTTTHCACYDSIHGSAYDCKYCQGEGYTWTERYIRAYFTQTFGRSLAGSANVHQLEPVGFMDKDRSLIYLKYDEAPKTGDAIYRISLNDDGNPYYPIERTEKWRVVNVEDKRYENAKIAYNLCLCERSEI